MTRPDLVETCLQGCFAIEQARHALLSDWGGEYLADADQALRRADLIRSALADFGSAVPTEVVERHTAWLRSLAGITPEEIPLGPAMVSRITAWTDVYAAPLLGVSGDAFKSLGEAPMRMPVPPREATEKERVLGSPGLGQGPRFVVLTDLHFGANSDDLVAAAINDINKLDGVEFVLVPGDLTDDGEPEQFKACRKALGKLDVEFHAVLGNHDAVRRSTVIAEGHHLFSEEFGSPPGDVILNFADWQVVLLDSTDPTPSPFPDWDLVRSVFRPDAGGTNGGAYREGQLKAAAAQLDPERPVFAVQHHELQPFAAFPPVMFGVRPQDSSAFFETFAGFDLRGVVAGHTHRSALMDVGVPQLEVPAIKDWPYAYTVFTMTDSGLESSVRQISDTDLVLERSKAAVPIGLRYQVGPQAALDHTF